MRIAGGPFAGGRRIWGAAAVAVAGAAGAASRTGTTAATGSVTPADGSVSIAQQQQHTPLQGGDDPPEPEAGLCDGAVPIDIGGMATTAIAPPGPITP
ncbi:MAG: hypothetical protein KGN74_07870 [Gemmatimonadota bacterium]|nr:hypothetical protein [Gemmatimonadota bacterium]